MNSKPSGKRRQMTKAPVVEGLQRVSKRSNNTGTGTGWDFDFSASLPRSKKSQEDLFQDDDDFRPSQSIESDIEENDEPMSPILSVPGSAPKRLKHFEDECDVRANVRSNLEDSDSEAGSGEEDIIANSQTDKRSSTRRHLGDQLPCTGSVRTTSSILVFNPPQDIGEDDIIVDVSDSENEIQSSTKTRGEGLTGVEWLNKVVPRTASQESGNISDTSSPSQQQQQTILDHQDQDDTSFWSSNKKKKRQAFGLVATMDCVLKKQSSDRVLRQHIAARKTNVIGPRQQCRKGRIEKVAKINRTLCFVQCRNLKLPQKQQSPCFRVIVNLRIDPDATLMDKLVPGNDVVIEGPWSVTKNSGQSEEEVLMNYDALFVVKNETWGYNDPDLEFDHPEPKILMDKDCECKGDYSRKTSLSRSKKFKIKK